MQWQSILLPSANGVEKVQVSYALLVRPAEDNKKGFSFDPQICWMPCAEQHKKPGHTF
jgi:hypothetical protein